MAIISPRSHVRVLGQALHLIFQNSPRLTLINGGLLLGRSVFPVGVLYFTKDILDQITQGSPLLPKFWILLGVIAGLTLGSELCRVLADYTQEIQTQQLTDQIYRQMHQRSISVDLALQETPEYRNLTYFAEGEVFHRPTRILTGVYAFIQNSISAFAIGLLLLSVSPGLTLLLVIAASALIGVKIRYVQRLYLESRQFTPQDRRASYFNWILTQPAAAKELRLFELGAFFQSRFQALRQQVNQRKQVLAQQRAWTELAINGLGNVAVFGVIGILSYQTVGGSLSVGSFVIALQSFQRGQIALRDTWASLTSIYENSLFLSSFQEFLQIHTQTAPPNPTTPPTLIGKIQFEQVCFRYSHSTHWVFENLSFTLNPQERVVLLAENGAGKSTLVKLLCCYYPPTHGRILLDGIDLQCLDPLWVRQQMSVVFQDYGRYQLTLRENITLARLAWEQQDQRLQQAAAQVHLQRLWQRLPAGYDSLLGDQFETGQELSTGEWQRIAIARAFFRDSPILILDELTSSLDPLVEAEIMASLQTLTQNRTTLVISHRLSTAKLADRILVLAEGQIQESGTHTELMQQEGLYYHLFTTQAQPYR